MLQIRYVDNADKHLFGKTDCLPTHGREFENCQEQSCILCLNPLGSSGSVGRKGGFLKQEGHTCSNGFSVFLTNCQLGILFSIAPPPSVTQSLALLVQLISKGPAQS